MSQEKWTDLVALAQATPNNADLPPAQMLPGGIRAERVGGSLRLSRAASA